MAISTGSLTITPVHPALGVEVGGVDLTRPLDDPTFARLAEASHPRNRPRRTRRP